METFISCCYMLNENYHRWWHCSKSLHRWLHKTLQSYANDVAFHAHLNSYLWFKHHHEVGGCCFLYLNTSYSFDIRFQSWSDSTCTFVMYRCCSFPGRVGSGIQMVYINSTCLQDHSLNSTLQRLTGVGLSEENRVTNGLPTSTSSPGGLRFKKWLISKSRQSF